MDTRKRSLFALMLFSASLCLGDGTSAANELRVKPGEFVIDHPTLINLGFEWRIDGDDNRNARVDVSYRKPGDAQWKQALPMLRLQGERIYQQGSWT